MTPRNLAAMLPLLFAAPAAADPAELAALRAEVAAMRVELDGLRAAGAGAGTDWTDPSRADEIRRVVEDAIAGADAAGSPGAAGHDGKAFFLEGEDHRVEAAGLLQFRHVALQNGASGAEDPSGFEVRRARIALSGHALDEDLTFFVQTDAGRNDGDVFVLDALVQYEFENGVQVKAGRMVLPFLYEQLLSIKRQLAVDRSLQTFFFNAGRSEQVRVDAPLGDRLRVKAAFSDGANRDRTGALNDATDFAFTGRAEARVLGDWSAGNDPIALDAPVSLLLGGAGHTQRNRGEAGSGGGTVTAWTADAVFKAGRLAALGSYAGATADGFDAFGVGLQAGVSVTRELQPFARYDFLDGGGVDAVQAVTAGLNWYLAGQEAKLTVDGLYVFDAPAGFGAATPPGLANAAFSSGLGLASPGGGDPLAIRTQLQLLF